LIHTMSETNNRNYDIEEFDWNDGGKTIGDQSSVDEVEHLVREALAVTTTVEDAYLKPSAVDNDRARITYNVQYALNENQKAYLKELVGDIRTITFNAKEYHDHPVSHCITELSEDLIVRKFGNEPFVSVWGNASRHRRLGHVGAKVVSNRVVPHDWFRNRGMEEVVTDVDTFVQSRGHLRYRLFLGTHTLYYTTLEEVAMWLGGNRQAEYYAIVHRHNKTKGHLNKGELQYTVNSAGIVHQVNPVTGMSYSHRSIEPLFHTDSCRLFDGKVGLTWDINRLAGDTYVIKFVLCDAMTANKVIDPWELIKKDQEVFVRGDVTVYRCLGFEWYVYHGPNKQVVLEDVELYDRLRTQIAGKERSPRAKSDLMVMCRRLANKNDIISVHQGFAHEISPGLMTDYVNAAFYADVKHELEVALMYHRENKQAIDALNRYIVEGVTPVDFTILGQVGRAVSAPFTMLSGLLNERSPEIPPDIVSGLLPVVRSQLPPDPFGIRGVDSGAKISRLLQSSIGTPVA
jgi:hypothetical protein